MFWSCLQSTFLFVMIWQNTFKRPGRVDFCWKLAKFSLWFEMLGLYYLSTIPAISEFPRLHTPSVFLISQFLDTQKVHKFSREVFSRHPRALVSSCQSIEFVFQNWRKTFLLCVAREPHPSASLPQEHPSFWADEKAEHPSVAFPHPDCPVGFY